MIICPRSMLTIPECSCPRCLEEQLRRFQPALLEAGPAGPRAEGPPATLPARTPGARADARLGAAPAIRAAPQPRLDAA